MNSWLNGSNFTYLLDCACAVFVNNTFDLVDKRRNHPFLRMNGPVKYPGGGRMCQEDAFIIQFHCAKTVP